MEKLTEKFTMDDVALSSPLALGNLVRASERVKDGGKFTFQGRTLVAHCCCQDDIRCSSCCFDFVGDICDFVSCVPEERWDNAYAFFTIEPAEKGESHE